MNTNNKAQRIVKQLALVIALGTAATANAQLLGGGGGGAGLGGMLGGGGSLGGQLGGMGSLGGRGALMNEPRTLTRSIDTDSLRRPSQNASGNAAGSASGNGSGSVSGSLTGAIDTNVVGSGRQAASGAIDGFRGIGQPLADSARTQVSDTRAYAQSSVANVRGAAAGTRQGVEQAGGAVQSAELQKAVNVNVGGAVGGSGSGSADSGGSSSK